MRRAMVLALIAAALGSATNAHASDPPADFSGAYLGLSTGYGFGASGDWCLCSPLPAAAGALGGEGGVVVGGEAGYGLRFGPLVVEASARASYADIRFFEELCSATDPCSGELAWLGEAEVAAGLTVYDILIAGSVGYAAGNVHANVGASPTTTSLHEGRVFGARIEQAMSDSWRMGLEYRYYDMSGTNDVAGTPVEFDWTAQSAALVVRYELPD